MIYSTSIILRDRVVEEALAYGTPNSWSAPDYAVTEILGELSYLKDLDEKAQVYNKLFSYINSVDGNLVRYTIETLITRLSKDINAILTPTQVALYIEQLFTEKSLSTWAIAEITPAKFRLLINLGLTKEQIEELSKEMEHLLNIENLDYQFRSYGGFARAGLSEWKVDTFKKLFLNALTLGRISTQEAESYIRDLLAQANKFYAELYHGRVVFINSEENNTSVLAALTLFEKELVELIKKGLSFVQILEANMTVNKGLLLELANYSYVQIKEPAIVGLIRLGEVNEKLVDDLKFLSLIDLPPLAGLEKKQIELSRLQKGGDFIHHPAEAEAYDRDYVVSVFYEGVFSGLIELAKLGVAKEEIKQWLSYFANDFYREFHESIRGQEKEFRWRAFKTHDLPLIIDMSAQGLMEYLSSP